MGDEWQSTTVGKFIESNGGEIKTGPFGTKLKASEYSNKGVPVISVGEVQLGRLVTHERTPKVDSTITDRMPEYLLREGDIVFGRKGAVERSARVASKQHGWFLGSDGIRLRLPSTCDSRFVSYHFLSEAHKQWMIQHAAGTTMASLNEKIVRRIPLTLPSLPEQKAIAHILGSIDDKIQLNRQMNATLEAMAQALFKSWFVDFDPVIDKALAAGNPIPEPLRKRAEARQALGNKRKPLPADVAQHFPDRFVFNEEMGWVPEGWEVVTIGRALELAYGKSLPAKKRVDGDIPVYGSGGISGSHNEKLVKGPGIIVGRKGTVGSLYWVEDDYFPIDTVFYVISKLDIPLYWIYQSLQLIDIKSLGADSAVPGVNRNAIYARFFTVPKDDIFKGYLNIIEKNIARRKNIDSESGILIQLRDTLLPKLLSGQLRIPNAENFSKDT